MNGREMSRPTSAKQTNAQTQAKQLNSHMVKSAEDTRYPSSKSTLRSDGNNAIGNSVKIRQRNFKNWPSYSSRSVEYAECRFVTFCKQRQRNEQ